MESSAEVERMTARRQQLKSADLEKYGETIIDLAIEDYRTGLGGRFLVVFRKRNQTLKMSWHKLKVGSPVVVSRWRDDDGMSLTGVVSRRNSDSLEVALEKFPEGTAFRIDLTADEITRQRHMSAVKTVMSSRGRLGHLRKVLMDEKAPRFQPESELKFQTQLNESQQAAVKFALSAEDVAIIHGPPGTGKTTTVVELIVQATKLGLKVLACAPSNTAVDNLLERLVAHRQRVVRIGHPARVVESLRDFSLDGLVEQHPNQFVIDDMYKEAEELFRKADKWTRNRPVRGLKQDLRKEAKRLQSDARRLERQAIESILDDAEVICATTTFNEEMLGDRWFDIAVIDEACQTTEPGCWVPLMRSDRVVLAGDPFQLPPTVLSIDAAQQGFAISMLERVRDIYGDLTTRMLTTQYRMHEQIMEFSSNEFYAGELVADPLVQEHRLCDLDGVTDDEFTQAVIRFIDTAGSGWEEELEPEGLSKRNTQEAEFILKKVNQLLESGLKPSEIAVIAPYAAQVRYLKNLMQQSSTEALCEGKVEVNTVDGFQGREKEAVLITLVRSNSTGEIGFLSDRRRMNVALTRARRKLIVVGDSATLGGHEFYQSLLKYFESLECYGTIWEE